MRCCTGSRPTARSSCSPTPTTCGGVALYCRRCCASGSRWSDHRQRRHPHTRPDRGIAAIRPQSARPVTQPAQPGRPAMGHWRCAHHFVQTPRPCPPTGACRMSFTSPLFIIFAAYLLLMIGLGFVAWRRTRTFDDYILGGRSLGSFVTALAAGASDMSGWLMMGLPGALYLSGASEAWIAVGLLLGAWANWKYVAGPLRVYTERTRNALTLPDYFTHRFEDHSRVLRILAALVILVFFAIYCASGIVAGTRMFESV